MLRTLVVHQAEGFSEQGMSLSFGWDPTPSSPLGLTAKAAPSWGGSTRGGAEALWGNQMAYGTGSHQMYGAGERFDAEVGVPRGRQQIDAEGLRPLAKRTGIPLGQLRSFVQEWQGSRSAVR